MSVRRVDVRGLEPPEPLLRTLAAVDGLALGDVVHMLHRRDPCLLFDNLSARGCDWRVCTEGTAPVEVFIWRGGDARAEAAALEAMAAE